ncbi:molybdopterin molybdotransferase MoeA [Spirosoma utsteinense]|uniref:Molybdopterin molybdenumtransferase n=1 Tax=Spirosoma utsteinense TaxID=2585773 RepID=A0ABR6W1V1_9BACT|nr:molybdopterin molybdotransferase MoeA [Spirosoma utsteinense]MBC3785239.1 molybdopterin molybdotransferase [Spirosoma utsteinense]MBC3790535.1 molybdopterin molybdotransferase [Spirosoma utsteinense]
MLSVSDAFSITQDHTLTLPTERVSLDDALGRILREPVRADRDFPPFDRVAMDGIGIRYADFSSGTLSFSVAGMQRAGQPQQNLTEAGTCLEVMTGAMLPIGADTVIRYEDITVADGSATIAIEAIQPGQNVHHRATDRQAGEELLSAGTRLGPAELAVAASVGHITLTVTALPRVALISTGDELVDVGDTPLPHQIRRSNTYMLRAALATLGIRATLHHIIDDEAVLADRLSTLLAENDVLILSGGVSAGKADFVPEVLAGLGVRKAFHKVNQRPGKPLWFGTTSAKTVFALPGNPVSTVLCAHRYVLPYLRASLGLAPALPTYAQLTAPVTFRPDITYFLPVQLSSAPDGRRLAQPLPGSGSADFANLLATSGFMELPADRSDFGEGEAFPVWLSGGI